MRRLEERIEKGKTERLGFVGKENKPDVLKILQVRLNLIGVWASTLRSHLG